MPLGAVGDMEAQGQETELRGERVVLRPVRVEDAPRLVELASHPEVARWWPDLTEKEVVEKADGRGDSTGFAIVHDGEVIGLIQYHEELDREYRHAGIDLFVGALYQDRGLGIPGTRPLTKRQLATRTPYNTRLFRGLPPTPIGNPGVPSMRAAARPAPRNYLYYVRKPRSVRHFFTADEDEFCRKVREYGYGGC